MNQQPHPTNPGPGTGTEDLLLWLFGWSLALTAAVSTLVWSTGQIAGLLFGHGRPMAPATRTPGIALALRDHATNPAAAWPPADAARLPGATGMYAAFTVTLTLLAVLVWAVLRVKGRIGTKKQPGARFAGPRDLTALAVRGPASRRIILGRLRGKLIATEPRVSLLVCGPTQSGKTSGLVIPAVLEWDGVVIASSVKRDLLDDTVTHRRGEGRVFVYDPTGATGLPTDTWSPLDASRTWVGAQATAKTLTESRGGRSETPNESFWTTSAAGLLAPFLLAAALDNQSIAGLMRWLNRKEITEATDILAAHGEEGALDVAWAHEHADTKTRDGLYSTALAALNIFQDPRVQASAATCDITPEGLLDGGGNTLYLCGPLHEQHRVRAVFETLLAQLIEAVADRHTRGETLPRPVLMVLDEAANIAAPAHLDQVISTAASMGLQLVTVWQDLSQLHARYGADRAQTIFSNSRARLLLPGIADATTLAEVTRIAGDTTVTQSHLTRDPRGGTSVGEGTTYRPLVPPDTLRQLPRGKGLLIYDNLPPVVVGLRPWWRDRTLRALHDATSTRRAA